MLVVYGGGIMDARGSIGGQTHSRNRYGAYVRARTKPINPNTDRQSVARAVMAEVAASYLDSASSAQRLEWSVFASNMPEKNKLGQTINFSGYNQYVKSNCAAQNAGLPRILDGPVNFTKPGQDPAFDVTSSEGSQEISVVFDENRDWAGEDNAGMIVQVGIPQNPSISFFNGPWQSVALIAGNTAVPITTPQVVTSPYPIVALQKVWVRAKIIRADGRISDWFQVSHIVGA